MSTGNFWKRHKFTALAVLMAAVISLGALGRAGFRGNLTSSLPKGVYRLTDEPPRKGDLVCFCLSSGNPFSAVARERNYLGNGSCPSGLRPLLKTLAGWPGDQVDITPNGLILDGEALLNTARLERDRSGREMPPSILSPGRIPDGLGLAVSLEHSGSFDSRYFGLVPFASLRKAEPIFVF